MTGPADDGGFVDAPGDGTRVEAGLVRVWGWARCGGREPARVEVRVDGRPAGLARIGQLRPDVAEALGDPALLWSGFEHHVELPGSADSEIAVTAWGLDGREVALAPVRVRSADSPAAGDGREGIERRTRPARAPHGPATVLVVGHSLDRAGAELCLLDVLRRLAARADLRFVVVTPRDGPLRGAVEALGVPVHVVGQYPTSSVALYEMKVAAIAAIGEQHGCDVVLANTMAAFCAGEVAGRLGVPLVWAVHEGWDPQLFWASFFGPGELHPELRRRHADALRSAAAILFVADATRARYEPWVAPSPCLTVPYGIDFAAIGEVAGPAARAAARQRLGIDDGDDVLLAIGPLVPAKCQSQLVAAFAEVASGRPAARLVLLGDVPTVYASALRDRVALGGLAARVRFEPISPDPTDWYLAADWLVVASDVESMPRTVVEALAFGLPVAATAVGGIPELIDGETTGLLCRPRDTAAMIAMLERALAAGPDERLRLAAAGARKARPRHDPEACAEAYAESLLAAVGERGAAGARG